MDTIDQNPQLSGTNLEEESAILSMDDIRIPEGMDYSEPDIDSSASDRLIENVIVPPHIAELMVPFAESPAGEDPRYGDDFVTIKTEIDKLTGNDYDEVLKRSRNILMNTGKDIRVAGYYIQAAVYVQGIQGLIDGIMLYRMLVDLFYSDIHPQKESAKLSSLEWINNNKIAIYAKHAIEDCTEAQIEKLKTEVQQFNEVLKTTIPEKPPLLTSFNKLLEDAKPKKELFIKPQSKPDDNMAQTSGVNNKQSGSSALDDDSNNKSRDISQQQQQDDKATSQPVASASSLEAMRGSAPGSTLAEDEITSDEEVLSSVRKISLFFLDKKAYLRSWQLTHAARWGGIKIPPNENNKTRLPAPRPAIKSDINNLLENNRFEEAFLQCQKYYMESTSHLCLDIQYLAFQAAEGFSNHKLASLIGVLVKDLIETHPGIELLQFDDGTPFADQETSSWLQGLDGRTGAGAQENVSLKLSDIHNNKLFHDLQDRVLNTFDKQGLQQALDQINEFHCKNEKETFHIKLLIAKLCLDDGKYNIGVPMLEELYQQATKTFLYIWEPEMALAVAMNLRNGIHNIMKKSSETQKQHYQSLLEELALQMCRWSPIQAAKLL